MVAPERDLTADVDAILQRVTERTRMVFLANPNNPTGTYLPFSEVKRLHAGLRSDIVLVLDAAYAEYVRNNDYSSGLELAATADNVVMTRTFSKIHGLAALRVGWAYAPAPVCDAMNRIRGAFNVNLPAIEAGIAAMEDRAHEDAAVVHNAHWAAWLTDALRGIGLDVVPSVGNFLLVGFPRGGGRDAAAADRYLAERGPRGAGRVVLRLARPPARDGRHRGSQPPRGRNAAVVHGGGTRAWLSRPRSSLRSSRASRSSGSG